MKEILYTGLTYSYAFLIPKKRGEGFVAYPIYHNHNALSAFLYEAGFTNTCGLDGYLDIEVKGLASQTDPAPMIKALTEFYGWPCRRVSNDEFFDTLTKQK